MSAFMIHSSAGGLVSLLNPVHDESASGISKDRDADAPVSDITISSTSASLAGPKYQCSICAKIFTSSGHLVRHGKLHTGVKDVLCPFLDCYKTCNRQDNMTQHYRVHLPSTNPRQSSFHVRTRLEEMRLNMEQTGHAPPLEDIKRAVSSASSDGTPLMNYGPCHTSPTPMQFIESPDTPTSTNATSTSPLSLPGELTYEPIKVRHASKKEIIVSAPGASSPTVEHSRRHMYEAADNFRNYRISNARGE